MHTCQCSSSGERRHGSVVILIWDEQEATSMWHHQFQLAVSWWCHSCVWVWHYGELYLTQTAVWCSVWCTSQSAASMLLIEIPETYHTVNTKLGNKERNKSFCQSILIIYFILPWLVYFNKIGISQTWGLYSGLILAHYWTSRTVKWQNTTSRKFELIIFLSLSNNCWQIT